MFLSQERGIFMNTKENQEKWIANMQKTLKLGGRSSNTFKNYKSHIKRFFRYFDKSINFKKVKENDILDYIKENYIDKNLSSETYNMAIKSIKYFYSICLEIELNSKILPNVKLKKRLPEIMEKKTFINIFNHENNIKYRCWLLLAFCSGLRVSEVANLRIENILPNEHKLKVLGKGNKERYTILPDITIKFLRLYCKDKRITKKEGFLFEGYSNHECINNKSIINYFTSLKKKYKLKENLTFHCLRHSFATYYLSNGGSLLALQSMLGHKSLNTTVIYLHLSQNFNQLEGIKYV